jgi:ABC-type lipoprotein export system ATPase subunit
MATSLPQGNTIRGEKYMGIDTQTNVPSELAAPGTDEQPTIVARDLCKVFVDGDEQIRAVDGVSFTGHLRQFIAITGPSGCGKSTLLYLLGSLEKPTSGHLTLAGVDVMRLEGHAVNEFRRHKIGFIFQSFHLVPNLSALENVLLPMELASTWALPTSNEERAQELLEQVGIDDSRQHHRPGTLSGGQQQRVAIARALANDPTVILADEPTGNVDSKNSKRIVALLRELAHRGRTIVVVTHNPSIARQADLHLQLEDGCIVATRAR